MFSEGKKLFGTSAEDHEKHLKCWLAVKSVLLKWHLRRWLQRIHCYFFNRWIASGECMDTDRD